MFAQLPMYQRKGPKAYNAKLDGIISLSAYLGDPHLKFKSIHVAGTNGKGSCSHMLASILQEAGYKVGLYTSPHLKDFRERIRINGEMTSKQFVMGFVKRHYEYLNTHKLSFFEMTVGMAFDYFARKKVDIAIIEVGLGGRLDSTNIITPEVCLITNIGLDHTNFLGTTLPEIAAEKAGIIKSGIPVVVSERQPETHSVFTSIAANKGAPLFYADQFVKSKYTTDLLGNYQQRNINGVLQVLNVLSGFPVTDSEIRKGLNNVVRNTGLLGRWQLLQEDAPRAICDIGHNREGIMQIVQQLGKEDYGKLHMVLGFVEDKDLSTMLPLFPKTATYYFARPQIARGLSASALRDAAVGYGLVGKAFPSVLNAYEAALRAAQQGDLVFVGGSTFTVAEVL